MKYWEIIADNLSTAGWTWGYCGAVTWRLALKFLYWPNARVTGSAFIRTRNCWKLQLQPPADDPQYGSILLWVDKDSGTLMRMEGYDSAGKLIKRFEVVSAQKIEDRWYLKQMRVEQIDPKSNKVTARSYLEINKWSLLSRERLA